MKILMFSEDPKIWVSQGEVRARMREYAEVLGELYVIVAGEKGVINEQYLFIYSTGEHRIMRTVSFYKKAKELCRNIKFDVITAQGADDIGLAAYCAARRFGISFQLQIHTDMLSPWYRRASWKEWVRYRIANFLIPRASLIRVVSQRIKNSLLRYNGADTKIYILPVFTDYTTFFEGEKKPEYDKRFSGYTFKMIAGGRFVEKEKNFFMLIEAMRDFVRVCPKALLLIVGEGPAKKQYEAKIKKNGLEKNIILDSWHTDLAALYKSFDLFLLSSNYEGWGRMALEAMASGLPVVMTDVGLAGEVVKNEKNGLVVPVGDKTAFLHAIEDLYKYPEKRKRIAAAGLVSIKNLKPRTKEEYLKKYRESFKF